MVTNVLHNNRLYKDVDGHLEITHSNGRHFRTPEILYKYYALNNNSVEAFTNHYLYAAHPLKLNDRFDCSPYLVSFEDFDEELKLLKEINPETKTTIEDLALDDFGGYNSEIAEYFYEKIGIISLAKEMNNTLMWSHYAKNDGFCVGFYVEQLPSQWTGPYPIDYSKHRESAIISLNQLSLLPLLLCYQKNSKWKYEKEYRCLVDIEQNGVRECEYPVDAIAEVYLGSSFFKRNEDKSDEDGNFKVSISQDDENYRLRTKVLDFICKNHTQTFVDLTLYIDDVYFQPYHGYGESGQYKFYW